MFIGKISSIDSRNGIIETDHKKKITLDPYHRDLPYKLEDSIIVNGKKLMFVVPNDSSYVKLYLKNNLSKDMLSHMDKALERLEDYIERSNYKPELEESKRLSSFLNTLTWKNSYRQLGGKELVQILGAESNALALAKSILEIWNSDFLKRQFKMWGIDPPSMEIMLEDFTISNDGNIDVEELKLTLSAHPSRFLYISKDLKPELIDHLVELFGLPGINPSIRRLKRSILYSDSSYINFTEMMQKTLGKELHRLGVHGLYPFDSNTKITLTSSYKMETTLFNSFKRKIQNSKYDWRDRADSFSLRGEGDVSKHVLSPLSPDQTQAIKMVLMNEISIITGGPGTGKTKVIHSIVKECKAREIEYYVAAFTGKAVARVKETAHPEPIEASTIDLLISKRSLQEFKLLILEESSMISLKLIYRLFKKYNPLGYKIVFVGDLDQIPPMEKGCIFSSLLWSLRIPYIRLTQNFRVDQKYGGDIIRNAQRIVDPLRNLKVPVELDITSNSFNVLKGGLDLIRSIGTKIYESGIDLNDLTVLSPYNEEVNSINKLFQNIRWGGSKTAPCLLDHNYTKWYIGDKIMCIRNDYDNNLINGDIGYVVATDPTKGSITVHLDKDQPKIDIVLFKGSKDPKSLSIEKNLKHAYCLTINKSQGSEYDTVILYLTKKVYDESFLNLNMIYTAITRAKKMVWVICEDPEVLLKACNKRLKVPEDIVRFKIVNHFKEEYKHDLVVYDDVASEYDDYDLDDF